MVEEGLASAQRQPHPVFLAKAGIHGGHGFLESISPHPFEGEGISWIRPPSFQRRLESRKILISLLKIDLKQIEAGFKPAPYFCFKIISKLPEPFTQPYPRP